MNKTDNKKLNVLLIAIAGTSNDFLLAPAVLKAYALKDTEIKEIVQIDIKYYKRIIPEEKIQDCEMIYHDILQQKPDVVGFSSYVWNFSSIEYLIKLIRDNNELNNLKIILGGPEIQREDIENGRFNENGADYYMYGEGEIPFQELIRYLSGTNENMLRDNIPRLAYRDKDKLILSKAENGMIDVFSAPSPYLQNYVLEAVLKKSGMSVNIETQRGCNFRCAYCLYHRNYESIRYRNIDTVMSEFRYLKNLGVKNIRITDANFFSNMDYAEKILEGMISENLKMKIFAEVIPNMISEKVAKLLEKYINKFTDNDFIMGIGLQSINPNSLKSIRRSLPVKYFELAYTRLLNAGVEIKTDIILGLPYETFDSYMDLLEFVVDKTRLGRNIVAMSLLRILPGSDLVEIAKKEDLILDINDNEHFVYSTPYMSIEDITKCLSYNAVISRILYSTQLNADELRNLYFEVKDVLCVSNKELMTYMMGFFNKKLELELSGSVYEAYRRFRYDYPHIRNPYNKIEDEIIKDELKRILQRRSI